jgi:hypothetical protein
MNGGDAINRVESTYVILSYLSAKFIIWRYAQDLEFSLGNRHTGKPIQYASSGAFPRRVGERY